MHKFNFVIVFDIEKIVVMRNKCELDHFPPFDELTELTTIACILIIKIQPKYMDSVGEKKTKDQVRSWRILGTRLKFIHQPNLVLTGYWCDRIVKPF